MKKFLVLFLTIGFTAAFLPRLVAEPGDDNPTGVTGVYSGNSTSGCSFDPFTYNTLRIADDISVPGCVVPLKWTRYNNGRHKPGTGDGWSFSYEYPINESGTIGSFPDGRTVNCWEDCPSGVEELPGGPLADGTQLVYTAYPSILGHIYNLLTQMIDPYGQVTNIQYDPCGTDSEGHTLWRRARIVEPGGRYLQLNYGGGGYGAAIQSVQAYDGRGNILQTVIYTWGSVSDGNSSFPVLSSVTYDDGTSANYTYQIVGNGTNKRPVLLTADDVRHSGPMRQIAYQHYTDSGRVQSEKKLSGEVLTTMTIGTGNYKRVETRGDGATRTFDYGNAGPLAAFAKLIDYTDFYTGGAGHHTTLEYENNDVYPYQWGASFGFLKKVTDANGHITTYERSGTSYAIKKVTFPDNSFIEQTYTDEWNPYYLSSRTARRAPGESPHTTTYTRDTSHRITRKDYPDTSFEEFVYNGFSQVLDHHLTSGGWEHFAYDTRGLKTSSTDALGNVTTFSYYSPGDTNFPAWGDRLKTVTKPANISGQVQTETYEYDRTFVSGVDTGAPCKGRGLVTKVTHTDGSTVTTTHNKWGDVLTATDELNHTTTNTYDDYGRLLATTDPLNHTTTNSYVPQGQTNSYVTTSNLPWTTTLPSTKQTKTFYDANWRKTQVQVAPNTADEANTYFYYDSYGGYTSIGNLIASKDPRNNVTTNHYDVCDRVDSVTGPAPFNYVTTFEFWPNGNKKKITPPSGGWTSFDTYDAMNRLTQKTVHRDATINDVTTMQYDCDGNLWKTWDERGYMYQYSYDAMNRRTSMIYPGASPAPHEDTAYDNAGNVKTYTNRNGKIQSFTFDNRNRATGFSWNDSITPSHTTVYDAASRVTQLANSKPALPSNITSTINFTYYNDNRLNTEEEWTSAFSDNVHRTITNTYDADGNRLTVQYPSGQAFNYTYTNRNQPSGVRPGLSGGTAIVSYVYDAAGNITLRTLDNNTSTAYSVDQINRETAVVHTLSGNNIRRFDYAYNNMSDITAVQRDSSLGDGYTYDLNQEISDYAQNGTVNLGNGTVANPQTNTTLTFDGCGNRTSKNGGGTYVTDSLNCPTTFDGQALTYSPNGNLWTYNNWTFTYDAQNRLTNAFLPGSKGGPNTNLDFYYDAKNRQIARNVNGAITFSVWDDWELVEEYGTGNVVTAKYLQGAHGPVKSLLNAVYFYQDSLGSTSHIASATGALLEYYKYDLYGKPKYYDSNNYPLSTSTVRDLFSGERWIPEMSMYDLRNRFYHPDLGRFAQPDPISFKGDSSNLYRYCGNDWANKTDPMGLTVADSIKLTVDQVNQIKDQAIVQAVETAKQDPASKGIPDAKLVEMATKIVDSNMQAAKISSGAPTGQSTSGSAGVSSGTRLEKFLSEHPKVGDFMNKVRIPDSVNNFAAGVGDGLWHVPFTNISVTDKLRDAMHINDTVNHEATSYKGGDVSGRTLQSTLGGAGIARGGAQIAIANRGNVVGRWLSQGRFWRLGGSGGANTPMLRIGTNAPSPWNHIPLTLFGH